MLTDTILQVLTIGAESRRGTIEDRVRDLELTNSAQNGLNDIKDREERQPVAV